MTGDAITPGWIVAMLALTLRAPARAAERLLMLRLPRGIVIEVLVLVTALSALVAGVLPGQVPESGGGAAGPMITLAPLIYAALLGASLMLMGLGLQIVGKALGGSGSLDGALTLVVWMEVLALTLRVVQMAAGLIAPPVGVMVSIVGLIVLLWTLLNFINVLHGFRSIGRSFLALLLAVAGISLGLAVILNLIGIGPAGGSLDV